MKSKIMMILGGYGGAGFNIARLYADSRGIANPTTDDQLCCPISESINLFVPRYGGKWEGLLPLDVLPLESA